MARIDFHRAAYQRPNPNMMCGKRDKPVATQEEVQTLLRCREQLKEAVSTSDETKFTVLVTDVMRHTKTLTLNRLKIVK